MQRTTITLDDDLVATLDEFMLERRYANRSEAMRDLVRSGLEQATLNASAQASCLGAVVYVYDHEARDLPSRLAHAAHDHHDLAIATMHVHLNRDNCMEVILLRGPVGRVRCFADQLIAERGVRYGKLVLVPETEPAEAHRRRESRAGPHQHSRISKR